MRARTWIATLSATTLALTTAAAAGGLIGTASATDTVIDSGTSTPIAAGVITLRTTSTGATGAVTYSALAGTTQTLSVSKDKCSLASTMSPSAAVPLLGFTSSATVTGSKPSWLKAGMGVMSSLNATGTACGQVNANLNETLTISLGTNAALSTVLGPAKAKSANFDVNLSGNAVIRAVFSRDGQPVGGAELQSGFSAPQPLIDSHDQLFLCNFNSNSGPQSGLNNNCYWQVAPLSYKLDTGTPTVPNHDGGGAFGTAADPTPGAYNWDSVTFTVKVGDFALQGGGAYGTSGIGGPTTISLVSTPDGSLACDVTQGNVAAQPGGSGILTDMTIWRLSNGVDTNCPALPYTLTNDGSVATFHKPLVVGGVTQYDAQFYAKLKRHFDPGVANPIPAALFNWEDPAHPDSTTAIPFCGSGVITSYDSSQGPDLIAGSDYMPFKPQVGWGSVQAQQDQRLNDPQNLVQYSCIYAQSSTVNPNGSVDTVDWLYFTGDIKFPTA